MDSELLLKFIGYFPDYHFGIVAYAFTLFLDNLCRNSCIKGKGLHVLKYRLQQVGKTVIWVFKRALNRPNEKKNWQCKLLLWAYERGTISCGRYMKLGLPFLSKLVHKRVRVWTSGQSLPVQNFLNFLS